MTLEGWNIWIIQVVYINVINAYVLSIYYKFTSSWKKLYLKTSVLIYTQPFPKKVFEKTWIKNKLGQSGLIVSSVQNKGHS